MRGLWASPSLLERTPGLPLVIKAFAQLCLPGACYSGSCVEFQLAPCTARHAALACAALPLLMCALLVSRWDVVQQDGAWIMRVSATKDIGPDEEVFFSYCERPNEGFLVQYGFTPTQNPHDSVTLFSTPEQAANWFIPKLPPELVRQSLAQFSACMSRLSSCCLLLMLLR